MTPHAPMSPRACTFTLLGALAVLAGCRHETAAPKEAAAPAVVEVAGVTAKHQAVTRLIEQPGMVEAYEETRLFARVPGYLAKVRVDIGQEVKGPRFDKEDREIEPGQVLAELAVPEVEQELQHKRALTRHAEAEVVQAKKALNAATAGIASAEANAREARALRDRWQSEAVRVAALVKKDIIDAQTRDEAQNQQQASEARLASAEAAVHKATADRDRVEADVLAAQARVDVARAETSRLESMLAYSKIRAPYDGVISMRKANTGDLVQPAAGKADWIFTIARLDPVRVVIAVPEADAALVRPGTAVKLSIKAAQDTPVAAAITRTSWSLESGTRTLRAEVDLPNPDRRFRPGMYVYATIQSAYAERWTLPLTAVVKQGNETVVFRIDEGKAIRTPVQTGRSDGQYIEIHAIQKADAVGGQAFEGEGKFALKATALTDGQQVRTVTAK